MAQAAAAGARAAEGNATASGNYSSLDGLSALMLLGEEQEGADAGGAAARATDARASAVEAALSAARVTFAESIFIFSIDTIQPRALLSVVYRLSPGVCIFYSLGSRG